MESNFKTQLKEFLDDKSYKDAYKDVVIKGPNYLIEIFKFRTKEGKYEDSLEDVPEILLINPLGGGITTNKAMSVDYTHAAKILKVGEFPEGIQSYKEGDCVLLNPYETTKELRNPDWLHYMEYQHSRGIDPIPPDDMREFLPSVQVRYLEYQFLLPGDYHKKVQEVSTFLIPDFKIKAGYKV